MGIIVCILLAVYISPLFWLGTLFVTGFYMVVYGEAWQSESE